MDARCGSTGEPSKNKKMDVQQLKCELAKATDSQVSTELVEAYEELKIRYYRRDFRPGQLEAGRLAEAAFRILQLKASGSYTPIGKALPKLPMLMGALESADASAVHESIRIHIPRTLAAVYNVRNRRDIGHIAADVNANSMDAEFVMSACNWVLAEFVRLFHQCSPEQAQAYVEGIVKRRAPLIQVFGDTPFVLKPGLSARDELLVVLYHQGGVGASLDQLDSWLPTIDRRIIRARLSELERRYRYVRRVEGRILITDTGLEYVESSLLSV
jgi:hypothetical protein